VEAGTIGEVNNTNASPVLDRTIATVRRSIQYTASTVLVN